MTLPAGWEARTDPQSGRTYYQNNLTKATQWEPPGAPPPPPPPHAGYAGIPGNPGASAGADYLLRGLQATNRSRCFWQLVFGLIFLVMWLIALVSLVAELFMIGDTIQEVCENELESGLDYEECVDEFWTITRWFVGISLTILVFGLLFATCAVSSSILYNTCNCYEPPADTKLLTIARLSNIAFMGHACASLLIYVPLGLAIAMLVFSDHTDPNDAAWNFFMFVGCIIYGLIASVYPCSAYVFRKVSVGMKEEHTARTTLLYSPA